MTKKDSSPNQPPKRKSRLLPRLGYTVAILAGLYLVIGFFVVPPVLKKVAVSQTSANLLAELDLESVSFNPLTLRLAVSGIALREKSGEPVFELAGAEVDAAWASLFRFAPVVQSIVLTEPTLHLTREADGRLNVERILPETTNDPEPAEEKPEEPFALPRLEIRQFAIDGGRVLVKDLSPAQPAAFTLEPFTFTLDGFSTLTGRENTLIFEGREGGGGSLTHTGRILLDPLGVEGVLTIRDLPLDQGSPYVGEFLDIELSGASLSLELAYLVNVADLANPLLTATVDHFELRETGIRKKGTEEPFFHLGLLRVGETRLAFPEARADVSSVRLEDGKLRAVRLPDGVIDLLKLLPEPANGKAPVEEASGKPAESPFAFLVEKVEIHNFEADLEDRSLLESAQVRAGIVSLTVENLSHDTTRGIPVGGAFSLNDDLILRLRGEAVPEPLAGEFELELKNLALAVANPWLGDELPFAIPSGHFSTGGTVVLHTPEGGTPVLRFDGGSRLEKFQLTDKEGNVLLGLEDLSLEEAVFISQPPKFEAGLLRISGPQIDVILDEEGNLNLTKGLPAQDEPAPAEEAVEPEETEPGMVFEAVLARLRIEDGRVQVRDRSVSPEFALLLDTLEVDLRNISTDPAARTTVMLSSRVDRSADLNIEGETSPLAADIFTDLRVRLDGYRMTSLSPFTGRHIGRTLAQGTLNLDVNTRINERALDAQTATVLDQLRLGERVESPDAVNLPLDLALSILRDRQGRISLDLPISGDLDDPQFSIAGIITQTLSNVVTRIASAPFSMLGNLFGGRGEELAFVSFAGGSSNLSTDARSKLEELANILFERPALNLEIEGRFYVGKDEPALARQRLGEAIMAHWNETNGRGPDSARLALEEEYLTAYYLHRFPPPPPPKELEVTEPNGETPPADKAVEEQADPETEPAPVEEIAEAEHKKTEAASDSLLANLRRWLVAPGVLERERAAQAAKPVDDPDLPDLTETETKEVPPSEPAPGVEVPRESAPEEPETTETEFTPPEYAEMKQALLETISITEEDLLALAKERGESVRDYLLSTEKVEAERLGTTGGTSGSAPEVHFDLR